MITSDLLTETDKRKLLNYFEKAERHRSVSKKRSRQYPANKLSFNKDELIKGGITFPGNYFQVQAGNSGRSSKLRQSPTPMKEQLPNDRTNDSLVLEELGQNNKHSNNTFDHQNQSRLQKIHSRTYRQNNQV